MTSGSANKKVRKLRAAAYEAQNLQCFYCTQIMTAGEVTADHKVPVIAGGKTDGDNIVACCRLCNGAKGDMHADEFMVLLTGEDPQASSSPHIFEAWKRRQRAQRGHDVVHRDRSKVTRLNAFTSPVKGISVSDRALLRYIEHVEGIDLSGLREAIRNRVRNGIEAGAKQVVVDGFIFVLSAKDRSVVTVMMHGRQVRRTPRDFREDQE